jgi:hypothetical protein
MFVYEKLDALNITLPELTPPVAAFVPFLRSGNLLFSSGISPRSAANHGSASWGRICRPHRVKRPVVPSPSI